MTHMRTHTHKHTVDTLDNGMLMLRHLMAVALGARDTCVFPLVVGPGPINQPTSSITPCMHDEGQQVRKSPWVAHVLLLRLLLLCVLYTAPVSAAIPCRRHSPTSNATTRCPCSCPWTRRGRQASSCCGISPPDAQPSKPHTHSCPAASNAMVLYLPALTATTLTFPKASTSCGEGLWQDQPLVQVLLLLGVVVVVVDGTALTSWPSAPVAG